MGNYTNLYIGNMHFSWEDKIPEFLAFIFDEQDYFVTYDKDGKIEAIGYKTTKEKAISILEKFGLSLEFCVEIYSEFYPKYLEYYYETIKFELDSKGITNEKDIINSLNESVPRLSRFEEYQNYIKYLENISLPEYVNPTYEAGTYKLNGRIMYSYPSGCYEIKYLLESGEYEIDFFEIGNYFSTNSRDIATHLYIIDYMLSEMTLEYADILTLIFLRTMLEVNSENETVILDLCDIVLGEDPVKNLLIDLPKLLMEKISLYNRAFHSLFQNKEDIQQQFAKNQCKEYFIAAKKSKVIYEKGKNLENLVELLFTGNSSLELVDKRVSTGDEEIDLVIKNNINRPFWLAFNSPLFFVECKNWSNPVGTNELRNFEIKMQNHSNLVKVGFFIAMKGFTREIANELKRMGRDSYHLILIDGNDIEEFLTSKVNFYSWLEKNASKIY